MKIAFLTNDLDFGGAEKMMAFVIECMSKYVDTVYLLLTQNKIAYYLPKNVKAYGVSEYCLNGNKLQKLKCLKKQIDETRDFIIKNRIEVICTFGPYYTLVAARAVKGTNCKLVGSERRSPQMLTLPWKLMSKYAYKQCDKVVFQLKGAREFYPSIPARKVAVIPNPYISAIGSTYKAYSSRRKVVSMAAARLEYEKGFDLGLKAMSVVLKSHPDYIVEMYGSGNFERMYGQLLDQLGIREKVIYKGLSNDIINDIKDSMVFLLPSRSEGIPNMLMEAMAAGIPCVASDCPPGGPKMLFKDGSGILVSMENYNQMAKAICKIIEDEAERNRLSIRATNVVSRFKPEKICEMWRKCFFSVVECNDKKNKNHSLITNEYQVL